jgi:hypothetical protein
MLKLKKLIEKEENINFIRDNLKADISKLLFKYAKNEEQKLLIGQIAARQKIRKKLPDFYSNLSLILPPSENLEQSTSTELAEFKANLVDDYQSFTDLTGGLGIDFIHFAKKAKHSTYIEPNKELFDLATHNFNTLGLKFDSVNEIAENSIKHLNHQDLIYIDPSRRDSDQTKIVRLEDYLPSVFSLYSSLAKKCKALIIKCSPLIAWQTYLEKLPHCQELWIISHRNECKEICFYLNFEKKPDQSNLIIKTYNLQKSDIQILFNNFRDEFQVKIGPITRYAYLPNSSIMKAGLMDVAAAKMGLFKLGLNTNVYSSDKYFPDFPGRVWSVDQVHKPYAKVLKAQQFNIVSRNFFDKASVIEQKLKLKIGGLKYLIAVNTKEGAFFIEASLLN